MGRRSLLVLLLLAVTGCSFASPDVTTKPAAANVDQPFSSLLGVALRFVNPHRKIDDAPNVNTIGGEHNSTNSGSFFFAWLSFLFSRETSGSKTISSNISNSTPNSSSNSNSTAPSLLSSLASTLLSSSRFSSTSSDAAPAQPANDSTARANETTTEQEAKKESDEMEVEAKAARILTNSNISNSTPNSSSNSNSTAPSFLSSLASILLSSSGFSSTSSDAAPAQPANDSTARANETTTEQEAKVKQGPETEAEDAKTVTRKDAEAMAQAEAKANAAAKAKNKAEVEAKAKEMIAGAKAKAQEQAKKKAKVEAQERAKQSASDPTTGETILNRSVTNGFENHATDGKNSSDSAGLGVRGRVHRFCGPLSSLLQSLGTTTRNTTDAAVNASANAVETASPQEPMQECLQDFRSAVTAGIRTGDMPAVVASTIKCLNMQRLLLPALAVVVGIGVESNSKGLLLGCTIALIRTIGTDQRSRQMTHRYSRVRNNSSSNRSNSVHCTEIQPPKRYPLQWVLDGMQKAVFHFSKHGNSSNASLGNDTSPSEAGPSRDTDATATGAAAVAVGADATKQRRDATPRNPTDVRGASAANIASIATSSHNFSSSSGSNSNSNSNSTGGGGVTVTIVLRARLQALVQRAERWLLSLDVGEKPDLVLMLAAAWLGSECQGWFYAGLTGGALAALRTATLAYMLSIAEPGAASSLAATMVSSEQCRQRGAQTGAMSIAWLVIVLISVAVAAAGKLTGIVAVIAAIILS